jgi:hypothetical protein
MAFVLDNAKYLPTYITEAEVSNLAVGDTNVVQRRSREFKGKILQVQEVSVDADGDVTVKIKHDNATLSESNALNLDHLSPFMLPCRSLFYCGLNTTVAKTNFAYRHGFWLLKPTVADKIFYGMVLSAEEQAIADEYDLARMVELGTLPLSVDTMLKRVFKCERQMTVSKHIDLGVAGAVMGEEFSPTDTILVLEGVALEKTATGAFTTACAVTVDEKSYHSLRAWAASGATYNLPFWIPCEDMFRLSLSTNIAIAGYDCRYTYSVVKLTEYLEMFLGMVPKEQNEDLWKRVVSGVGPE